LDIIINTVDLQRGMLDNEDDDMEEGPTEGPSVKTKNEIEVDTGPVDLRNITIPADVPVGKLGYVEKVMGWVAIVRADMDGEYRVLDEGGVAITEMRQPIGIVCSLSLQAAYF
jgi:hypothetical protein